MIGGNGKVQPSNCMEIRTFCTIILLTLILFGTYFIRIQSIPNIPDGQLTGPDAYFYYWQAQLVSENGKLPEKDMHRWIPLGRDLSQTLNLYGYTLAYGHKALALLFPRISLYHVTLYAPVICFCIGLGALYLFLYHTFGFLFSNLVGVLLASLPGTIERSAAGFSDRDSWCLMLGILTVTTYLTSLQSQHPRKRLLWTLISGFTMFLGGISWEGFGVFLIIILTVEIWRFLTSETEDGLVLYLLWVCTFVPTLYLISPAYRSGQGFATHIAALMFVPPLGLLGIRYLRYLLITKVSFAKKFQLHTRTLTLVFTLASITVAFGYVFIQRNTFAVTTVPLSHNALMQTVGELDNPSLKHWIFRYGSVFTLGTLGIIMGSLRFWKIQGISLAIPLTLFAITTFYRSRLDEFWGITTNNILFGIAVITCLIGFIILAWYRQRIADNEVIYIAFITWFLLWIALTRDAKRYDFFIGVSIAFFTADLICFLADFYSNRVKHHISQQFLKAAITGVTLILIMFWTPTGGHAHRTMLAAVNFRHPIPGNSITADTFEWIKSNLPDTAVVAARWDHGSMLNVLTGVKTITDQDHYIQYWIHLYDKHVRNATSEREALEFLKTHLVTHLMLTHDEPVKAPFLRGVHSNSFVPVYPTDNFEKALVKVWAIHYSPDIQSDPKYLATEPEE